MGSCKINAPAQKPQEEPIYEKQNSVNNKRVFVLQRVKNNVKQEPTKTNNFDIQNEIVRL